MAEVVGTALGIVGAVGVLGQIFTGCVNAYGFFTSAASMGRDTERFLCKVRIEEMRLLVWGRQWGVVEGKLEAHLQAQFTAGNECLQPLATQILNELYQTITDFRKLQSKYGLREEPMSPGEEKKSMSIFKNGLTLRTKWVIGDKDKFTLLLGDLKDYNDGLEKLFPPTRLATVHRTWQNELLQDAQRDLGKLSLLETVSSGVYPQLNASASLKQLRINLDSKPTSAFKPTFALKIRRELLTIPDNDNRRSQGTYINPSKADHDDVIVEWVEYDKEDLDGRLNHVRRIDDLARIAHSASDRHPDLHAIDCLGYTDDSSRSRYGLVYKAPANSYATLHSLIASTDFRTPDLNDRFKLAHTLAIAIWSLHSLDWLHKSLSSFNVLFFPSVFASSETKAVNATVANISSPYLLGFDLSRPDHLTEMSVASKNTPSMDLHRHPHSLNGLEKKTYCKSYDIYSLGLVLLEIGLWKVLQTYYKPHYTAEKFRDKVVLPVLVPGLGSKTGILYKEVTERCLSAKDSLTGEAAGALMGYVVSSLESLRV